MSSVAEGDRDIDVRIDRLFMRQHSTFQLLILNAGFARNPNLIKARIYCHKWLCADSR